MFVQSHIQRSSHRHLHQHQHQQHHQGLLSSLTSLEVELNSNSRKHLSELKHHPFGLTSGIKSKPVGSATAAPTTTTTRSKANSLNSSRNEPINLLGGSSLNSTYTLADEINRTQTIGERKAAAPPPPVSSVQKQYQQQFHEQRPKTRRCQCQSAASASGSVIESTRVEVEKRKKIVCSSDAENESFSLSSASTTRKQRVLQRSDQQSSTIGAAATAHHHHQQVFFPPTSSSSTSEESNLRRVPSSIEQQQQQKRQSYCYCNRGQQQAQAAEVAESQQEERIVREAQEPQVREAALAVLNRQHNVCSETSECAGASNRSSSLSFLLKSHSIPIEEQAKKEKERANFHCSRQRSYCCYCCCCPYVVSSASFATSPAVVEATAEERKPRAPIELATTKEERTSCVRYEHSMRTLHPQQQQYQQQTNEQVWRQQRQPPVHSLDLVLAAATSAVEQTNEERERQNSSPSSATFGSIRKEATELNSPAAVAALMKSLQTPSLATSESTTSQLAAIKAVDQISLVDTRSTTTHQQYNCCSSNGEINNSNISAYHGIRTRDQLRAATGVDKELELKLEPVTATIENNQKSQEQASSTTTTTTTIFPSLLTSSKRNLALISSFCFNFICYQLETLGLLARSTALKKHKKRESIKNQTNYNNNLLDNHNYRHNHMCCHQQKKHTYNYCSVVSSSISDHSSTLHTDLQEANLSTSPTVLTKYNEHQLNAATTSHIQENNMEAQVSLDYHPFNMDGRRDSLKKSSSSSMFNNRSLIGSNIHHYQQHHEHQHNHECNDSSANQLNLCNFCIVRNKNQLNKTYDGKIVLGAAQHLSISTGSFTQNMDTFENQMFVVGRGLEKNDMSYNACKRSDSSLHGKPILTFGTSNHPSNQIPRIRSNTYNEQDCKKKKHGQQSENRHGVGARSSTFSSYTDKVEQSQREEYSSSNTPSKQRYLNRSSRLQPNQVYNNNNRPCLVTINSAPSTEYCATNYYRMRGREGSSKTASDSQLCRSPMRLRTGVGDNSFNSSSEYVNYYDENYSPRSRLRHVNSTTNTAAAGATAAAAAVQLVRQQRYSNNQHQRASSSSSTSHKNNNDYLAELAYLAQQSDQVPASRTTTSGHRRSNQLGSAKSSLSLPGERNYQHGGGRLRVNHYDDMMLMNQLGSASGGSRGKGSSSSTTSSSAGYDQHSAINSDSEGGKTEKSSKKSLLDRTLPVESDNLLKPQAQKSVKRSTSPLKLSLIGAKRRLWLKQKGISSISVQRSEEIAPPNVRHLVRQMTHDTTMESSSSQERSSPSSRTKISQQVATHSLPPMALNESPWWISLNPSQQALADGSVANFAASDPRASFIEGLGQGQVASRQALVSPYLGNIQLSLSDQRGMLEVEVVRARRLHAKVSSTRIPVPFVKVYLMREKKCIAKCRTSKPVGCTLDPLFQEKFIFRNDYTDCILQVIVWGDYGKKHDRKSLMGIVQIQLNKLDISNLVIGWYQLFNAPSMASSLVSSSKSLRQTMLSFELNNNNNNQIND